MIGQGKSPVSRKDNPRQLLPRALVTVPVSIHADMNYCECAQRILKVSGVGVRIGIGIAVAIGIRGDYDHDCDPDAAIVCRSGMRSLRHGRGRLIRECFIFASSYDRAYISQKRTGGPPESHSVRAAGHPRLPIMGANIPDRCDRLTFIHHLRRKK